MWTNPEKKRRLDLLIQKGEFDEAVKLCKDVVNELSSRGDTEKRDSSDLAIALEDLGQAYYESGNYIAAKKCFSNAISEFKLNRFDVSKGIARCFSKLGGVLLLLSEDPKTVEDVERHAISIFDKIPFSDRGSYPLALTILARSLALQSKFADAQKLLVELLDWRKSHYGPEHPRFAACYVELSSLYSAQGRIVPALKAVEKAIRICRRSSYTHNAEFAMMLAQAGELSVKSGSDDRGERLLHESLEILEGLLPIDHPLVVNVKRLSSTMKDFGSPFFLRD